MSVIDKNSKVSLNFAIKLADGSVVDSNFDQAPCSFEFGDGNLLPGFEESLLGMAAGQRAEHVLSAEQGFGEPNTDNELTFSRKSLESYDLELGLMLSFADASGERPGVVKEIGEEQVLVDFNHPLAGRELIFDVLVHSVETAELPKA